MARKAKVAGPMPASAASAAAVPDVDPSMVTVHTLPAGTLLHRIHPDQYGPVEFNPGTVGNARFSPIQTPAGKAIPTMYAGEDFDCAAMETVYHKQGCFTKARKSRPSR